MACFCALVVVAQQFRPTLGPCLLTARASLAASYISQPCCSHCRIHLQCSLFSLPILHNSRMHIEVETSFNFREMVGCTMSTVVVQKRNCKASHLRWCAGFPGLSFGLSETQTYMFFLKWEHDPGCSQGFCPSGCRRSQGRPRCSLNASCNIHLAPPLIRDFYVNAVEEKVARTLATSQASGMNLTG